MVYEKCSIMKAVPVRTSGSAGAVDPQVISPIGHAEEKTTVDLPDVATGTMRSSGTYIALLLQLEGEKWEQIDVLTDVMELLGITCNDIEERKRFLETED